MSAKKNRMGEKFNRLLVIGEGKSQRHPNGKISRILKCQCDCGKICYININNLRTGDTKSCGCFAKEGNNRQHEMAKTRFYHIWASLKRRCGRRKYYLHVSFDTEWKSFLGFKKDMYKSYLEHVEKFGENETSIDRIDNLLGYYKNNCRWATKKEQSLNRNLNYTFDIKLKHKNLGISFFKWGNRTKRWVAKIGHKEKGINLGYFKTAKEARKARKEAEKKYNKKYA